MAQARLQTPHPSARAAAQRMLGRISRVGDHSLGLQVAANVEVEIQRSAVVQVLPKGSLKS